MESRKPDYLVDPEIERMASRGDPFCKVVMSDLASEDERVRLFAVGMVRLRGYVVEPV